LATSDEQRVDNCKVPLDLRAYGSSGLRLLDRVVTQKGMNAAYPIDHLGYAQVHN